MGRLFRKKRNGDRTNKNGHPKVSVCFNPPKNGELEAVLQCNTVSLWVSTMAYGQWVDHEVGLLASFVGDASCVSLHLSALGQVVSRAQNPLIRFVVAGSVKQVVVATATQGSVGQFQTQRADLLGSSDGPSILAVAVCS